jgi:hypothetical protein
MNITSVKLNALFTAVVKAELSFPTREGTYQCGEGLEREPTSDEIALKAFTESLSKDEKKDVLALMWLGLGKGFKSFQSARAQVASYPDIGYEIRSRRHLVITSIINGLRIQIK